MFSLCRRSESEGFVVRCLFECGLSNFTTPIMNRFLLFILSMRFFVIGNNNNCHATLPFKYTLVLSTFLVLCLLREVIRIVFNNPKRNIEYFRYFAQSETKVGLLFSIHIMVCLSCVWITIMCWPPFSLHLCCLSERLGLHKYIQNGHLLWG